MKYKGRAESTNIEDRRSKAPSNDAWSYLMSPEEIGTKTSNTFQPQMTPQQNYSFQTDITKNGN